MPSITQRLLDETADVVVIASTAPLSPSTTPHTHDPEIKYHIISLSLLRTFPSSIISASFPAGIPPDAVLSLRDLNTVCPQLGLLQRLSLHAGIVEDVRTILRNIDQHRTPNDGSSVHATTPVALVPDPHGIQTGGVSKTIGLTNTCQSDPSSSNAPDTKHHESHDQDTTVSASDDPSSVYYTANQCTSSTVTSHNPSPTPVPHTHVTKPRDMLHALCLNPVSNRSMRNITVLSQLWSNMDTPNTDHVTQSSSVSVSDVDPNPSTMTKNTVSTKPLHNTISYLDSTSVVTDTSSVYTDSIDTDTDSIDYDDYDSDLYDSSSSSSDHSVSISPYPITNTVTTGHDTIYTHISLSHHTQWTSIEQVLSYLDIPPMIHIPIPNPSTTPHWYHTIVRGKALRVFIRIDLFMCMVRYMSTMYPRYTQLDHFVHDTHDHPFPLSMDHGTQKPDSVVIDNPQQMKRRPVIKIPYMPYTAVYAMHLIYRYLGYTHTAFAVSHTSFPITINTVTILTQIQDWLETKHVSLYHPIVLHDTVCVPQPVLGPWTTKPIHLFNHVTKFDCDEHDHDTDHIEHVKHIMFVHEYLDPYFVVMSDLDIHHHPYHHQSDHCIPYRIVTDTVVLPFSSQDKHDDNDMHTSIPSTQSTISRSFTLTKSDTRYITSMCMRHLIHVTRSLSTTFQCTDCVGMDDNVYGNTDNHTRQHPYHRTLLNEIRRTSICTTCTRDQNGYDKNMRCECEMVWDYRYMDDRIRRVHSCAMVTMLDTVTVSLDNQQQHDIDNLVNTTDHGVVFKDDGDDDDDDHGNLITQVSKPSLHQTMSTKTKTSSSKPIMHARDDDTGISSVRLRQPMRFCWWERVEMRVPVRRDIDHRTGQQDIVGSEPDMRPQCTPVTTPGNEDDMTSTSILSSSLPTPVSDPGDDIDIIVEDDTDDQKDLSVITNNITTSNHCHIDHHHYESSMHQESVQQRLPILGMRKSIDSVIPLTPTPTITTRSSTPDAIIPSPHLIIHDTVLHKPDTTTNKGSVVSGLNTDHHMHHHATKHQYRHTVYHIHVGHTRSVWSKRSIRRYYNRMWWRRSITQLMRWLRCDWEPRDGPLLRMPVHGLQSMSYKGTQKSVLSADGLCVSDKEKTGDPETSIVVQSDTHEQQSENHDALLQSDPPVIDVDKNPSTETDALPASKPPLAIESKPETQHVDATVIVCVWIRRTWSVEFTKLT